MDRERVVQYECKVCGRKIDVTRTGDVYEEPVFCCGVESAEGGMGGGMEEMMPLTMPKPKKKPAKKKAKDDDEEEEEEKEEEETEDDDEDEAPKKKGKKDEKSAKSDKKAAKPEAKAGKRSGAQGVTASIKKIMLGDPQISVENLTDALKEKGFDTISNMTVTTVRADFRHTLRIMKEEGGLSKALSSKMDDE